LIKLRDWYRQSGRTPEDMLAEEQAVNWVRAG
jgi:hypothetical protein